LSNSFKVVTKLVVVVSCWLLTASALAQEKLDKIYVGVAGLSGALAHAFIPKDSGLCEKYGLDVELIFFQGGTQAIQATLAAVFRWLSLRVLKLSPLESPAVISP